MRTWVPVLLASVWVAAGCTGGTQEETPKAKAPDVTAEQAAKNLEKSNAPEAAKRVMGAGMNQNQGGSPAPGSAGKD